METLLPELNIRPAEPAPTPEDLAALAHEEARYDRFVASLQTNPRALNAVITAPARQPYFVQTR